MLQIVLDSIPAAVFWKNLDLLYIGGNRTWLEVIGLKSLEGVIGKSDYDLPWEKKQADSYREYDRKVIESGIPEYNIIESYLRANGTQAWARTNKIPLRDAEGKVVGVLGTFEDITERKQAEEALKESEYKYKILFADARQAIFIAEVESGILIDCNEAACALIECTREEIIGKHQSFLHPADELVEGSSKSYRKHISDETGRLLEDRVITKLGKIKEVEIKGNLVEFKGKKILQGFFIDITERKQAEKALRESEDRFRRLVESVTDYIYSVKIESGRPIVTFHAPACVTVTGYTSEEYVADPDLWYRMVYQEDKQMVKDHTSKVLSGIEVLPIEHRIVHKNGSMRWVRNTPVLLRNDQGVLVAYDGLIADITELKEAEEERNKLQAELIQTHKMQSIGTLAGGIAHDFNNLLGIILGYTQLLESYKADNKKFSDSIGAISQTIQRGAALVRQILTFARKTDVAFEMIHIIDIVHELFSMLRQTFPRVISFTEEFEKDLPCILADRTQIHQALLNLCVNARDAMPNGGVISISCNLQLLEQVQGRFPAADQSSYICVSVADTGEGMDEVTRLRAFDPFFTTKPVGKGTGMGLSVVYGIVHAHHGFVDVESELGHGTTFRLYFPVQTIAEDKLELRQPSELYNIGGTETILLVEDEELLIEMVRLMLESKGYTVYYARDGISAVDIYREHRETIALILTDMGLPGLTGIDEFKKLKEIDQNVNVVFASGFFDPDVKSELLKAGAKGFIQKPYAANDILRTVREVLDKK